MIVSASRRTDIPAFYGRWLAHRMEAGFCEVANPFNPKQVSRVSLKPADVDALVLWTRHPRSLLPVLPRVISRGIPIAALYTITDYPPELEPGMPPLAERIEAFKRLCGLLPPGAVVWRYDPIILSNLTPVAHHLERFEHIAGELAGLTDRVIVSVLQEYRSVMQRLRRVPGLELADHANPAEELLSLPRRLSEIAAEAGMTMQSCADPRIEGVHGLTPGGCIDEKLLRNAGYAGRFPGRDPNQRGACRCLASRDIGAYETCLFDCTYCYATHGADRARENARRHDPRGTTLLGTGGPPNAV